jgi:hypothetical protein
MRHDLTKSFLLYSRIMKPFFKLPLFAENDPEPSGGSGGNPPPEKKNEGGDDAGEGEGGNGGGEEPEQQPQPPQAPAKPEKPAAMSPFQRGQLMVRSKNALIQEIAALRAANAAQAAQIKDLTAKLQGSAAASNELNAAQEEIKALKTQQTTVSKEVQKELSGLGVSQDNAPAQQNSDQTPAGLLDTFNNLQGAEKIAFFRKHKAALKAAEMATKK